MIFLLVLLFFLVIGSVVKGENTTYLSFDCTSSVKGIFVIIVFLQHFRTYPKTIPFYDVPVMLFCDHLGQLMVTMFLFYSGYGVYENIKAHGNQYIKQFPRKRFLKVLLQFDLAVLLFLLLGVFIGEDFSLKQVLLSLIAWKDLGNSNWFIFAILYCYFTSYVCFLFLPRKFAMVGVFVFCVLYIVTIQNYKTTCWWDTIICYPFGLFFSYFKDEFEKIMRSARTYYALVFLSIFSLLMINHYINEFVLLFSAPIRSLLFCVLLSIILYKHPLNNQILQWFGKFVFPMYILQRIPMILFQKAGLDCIYGMYICVCFVSTIVLSCAYSAAMKRIRFLWS